MLGVGDLKEHVAVETLNHNNVPRSNPILIRDPCRYVDKQSSSSPGWQ